MAKPRRTHARPQVFVAMEIGTDKFIASLGKLIPFWTIIGLCDVWLLLVGNNEAYAMIAISAIFSRSAITIVDATLVKTVSATLYVSLRFINRTACVTNAFVPAADSDFSF